MKRALFLLLLTHSLTVYSQEKKEMFNEFYVGFESGSSYMFGGAQVDNVETIGQGNVPVLGGTIGWQKNFKNRLTFGADFQLNKPFGVFENTENPDGTEVVYFIKPQSALQFNLGYTLGAKRNHEVFLYFAFNQTRFDIEITRPIGEFYQTDFENYGKIGVGYEFLFSERFSSRIYAGSSMDALPGTINGPDVRLSLLFNLRNYSKAKD